MYAFGCVWLCVFFFDYQSILLLGYKRFHKISSNKISSLFSSFDKFGMLKMSELV